ncbi:MAG: hypothetical protein Q9169_008179, partial [Polycauliona sp. 2 TL-2023]
MVPLVPKKISPALVNAGNVSSIDDSAAPFKAKNNSQSPSAGNTSLAANTRSHAVNDFIQPSLPLRIAITHKTGFPTDSGFFSSTWLDPNAPFIPIPGHPLNKLFPELVEDYQNLSAATSSGNPVPEWFLSDFSDMDHVADAAALVQQTTDLGDIDASLYE